MGLSDWSDEDLVLSGMGLVLPGKELYMCARWDTWLRVSCGSFFVNVTGGAVTPKHEVLLNQSSTQLSEPVQVA